MNLLKDLIKNIRYTCLTTNDKEIYIYLYYAPNESLTTESETSIETRIKFLENSGKTITKKVVETRNENDVNLNKMNDDIANYINNTSGDINKIYVINTSISHTFILESKVFKAMSDKSSSLSFDMGLVSGFRLTGYDYKELDEINITESIIYLDKSSVLYVSKFFAKWTKLISYNKSETPSTLNLFSSTSTKILSLYQYGPTKLVFGCTSKTGTEFASAKLEINYLNIFGDEIISSDKNDERILVKGYNKVYFDNIKVDDDIVYSTILRVDRVSNFNIGKFERTVYEIVPKPIIYLERVGKVNLRQLNLTISSSGTINENDFALVSFLTTDDDFDKSITLSNCNIYNESDKKLKVIKINKLNITKVYISKCTIGDNIDLLNVDNDSSVVKLTWNNCEITTNSDFTMKNCTKLSIVDTTINCNKNIYIESPYININGGIWSCDSVECDYTGEYMKILLDKLELHSNYLNIINTNEEVVQPVFLNNCKFDVLKGIKTKNLTPSVNGGYIKTEKLEFITADTIQLNTPVIGFQDNDKSEISCHSSVSGNLIIENVEDVKFIFSIDVTDEDNTNVNNIDINILNEKTNINFTTNRGFNSIIDGISDKTKINLKCDDNIDDTNDTYIKLVANDDGAFVGKVINNSEKIVEYTKTDDTDNALRIYKFSKIE